MREVPRSPTSTSPVQSGKMVYIDKKRQTNPDKLMKMERRDVRNGLVSWKYIEIEVPFRPSESSQDLQINGNIKSQPYSLMTVVERILKFSD